MRTPAPGRLLCLGGPPGSGKTTLGTAVARAAGAVLVDLDSVTTALVEAVAAALGVPGDLDAPALAALRPARYRCLGAVAADNLAGGHDVVAVAPFTREAAHAQTWRAWGSGLGAAGVTTCWLALDPRQAAERARERGLPRDLAKAGRVGPPARVDTGGVDVLLDGREGVEELAGRVCAAWVVGPPGPTVPGAGGRPRPRGRR